MRLSSWIVCLRATAPTFGRPAALAGALAVCAVLSFAVAGCADKPAQAQPAAAPAAAPAPSPKPAQVRPAEHAPGQDLYYDPANPAFAQLQKADEALAGFPVDNYGKVDWMAALRAGLITPRANVDGTRRVEVLDMDIIMKNTRQMPYVLFPHRAHTQWLDCSNCHPAIFESKAGAHQITMNDIFRGQYCGKCHDRVAFITYFSCERCHRVPHGEIKAWWEQ